MLNCWLSFGIQDATSNASEVRGHPVDSVGFDSAKIGLDESMSDYLGVLSGHAGCLEKGDDEAFGISMRYVNHSGFLLTFTHLAVLMQFVVWMFESE